MAGRLIITTDNEKCCGIELSGRVNFETVIPLRDFVNNMPQNITDLTVDLTECMSMDSTCMGVLSMLALSGFKRKLQMRVLNVGANRQLLKGLGVDKLFKFEDGTFERYSNVLFPEDQAAASGDLQAAAETVLEAHQTLIDADEGNHQRFDAVVEMTRQDLDRLKNK